MNSFFKETFETDSPIERIAQKEYTILFRSLEQVTFCYVFTGPSLKAVNKFEKFISDLITSDEFKTKVKESLISGRALHNDPWLGKEVLKTFKK